MQFLEPLTLRRLEASFLEAPPSKGSRPRSLCPQLPQSPKDQFLEPPKPFRMPEEQFLSPLPSTSQRP